MRRLTLVSVLCGCMGSLVTGLAASASVSITADVSTVAAGGSVTFTVTVTPNDYVSKVILTYEGESGQDEDTTAPYVFYHQFDTPADSLTVTATAEYNNGAPDEQDTTDVDVVGLQLTGSSIPLRAWSTTYVAQSDPAGKSIDQFNWIYAWLGGSNTYQDNDSDNDDKSRWSGKMVVSGTITCSATVSGVSVQKSLTVNVRPRTWAVTITCEQDNESNWGEQPLAQAALGCNRDRESNQIGYLFVPQSAGPDFTAARTLSEITSGPCSGWWYVSATTLKCQRETTINKYIKSGGPAPSGASENFYDANNSLCFAPEFSSGDFVTAVAHHEYRGTPLTFKSIGGHQGRIEKAILDLGYDPKAAIESLVNRDSSDLADAVNETIAYHQSQVDYYYADEWYMQTYGPNWGYGDDALGWGMNSRWDSFTTSWSECNNGPDQF